MVQSDPFQFDILWKIFPNCCCLLDDCVQLWYVLYKVLVTTYMWGSLIYTWADTNSGSKYLIYMTNWGICFINFTILLETVVVTLLYFGITATYALSKKKYFIKRSYLLESYYIFFSLSTFWHV